MWVITKVVGHVFSAYSGMVKCQVCECRKERRRQIGSLVSEHNSDRASVQQKVEFGVWRFQDLNHLLRVNIHAPSALRVDYLEHHAFPLSGAGAHHYIKQARLYHSLHTGVEER